VVAARIGRRADPDGTGVAFRVGGPETGASDAFAAVLVLDALGRAAAEHAFATAAHRHLPAGMPAHSAGGVYDLVFAFPGADPAERLAHRRAHWRRR
jgi:hypothetical protein